MQLRYACTLTHITPPTASGNPCNAFSTNFPRVIIARGTAAAVRRKRAKSLREKRAVSFANLLITRDATASDEFLINTNRQPAARCKKIALHGHNYNVTYRDKRNYLFDRLSPHGTLTFKHFASLLFPSLRQILYIHN